MALQVTEATSVDRALVASVQKLLPQLSTSAEMPTAESLTTIIEAQASHLFVAREGGLTLGMLTLVVFPIPSGVRAWIEDVVVDESGRGKGVGEALSRHAIEVADRQGAKTIELTSRPNRVAANRLYQRLGFVRRETNVYRYSVR